MYRVVSFEILNDVVRTQFVTTPKMVLGSYVKGPNNIICKAWAERLSLGHLTVVSHGTCAEVNHVCSRSLSPRHGLGGSGSWPFFPATFLDCLLLFLY